MSFWKNRPLIITVILIIVLIVLLVATSGQTTKEGYVSVIDGVAAPIQEGLYNASSGLGGFFSRLFATGDLNKENLELREQVAELESKLKEYDEIVKENERLKELLNVKDTTKDYDIITAQVIGKSYGQWIEQFTVNVGTKDGVGINMIVLTDKGLMGKVISASENSAKIISLMNATGGVPAMIERTRDYGVVKAAKDTESKEKGLLSMEYMAADSDVVPGDKIITSGMGGTFPKGLYIGVVSEVKMNDNGESVVLVQSAVDFAHVEEVSVVLKTFNETEGE